MSTQRRLFLAVGFATWIVAAGCSDNPAAVRAIGLHPDMTEEQYPIPGPSPSVTDSSGTPLISWSALSGATSYTVSLVYYDIYDQWGSYDAYIGPSLLGEITTTTSTSYLDTGNVYTGSFECRWYPHYGSPYYGNSVGILYAYAVQATFPHGTSDISYYPVVAPIAPCYS